MARTSDSMERPCRAARTRRRPLVSSSSPRIVSDATTCPLRLLHALPSMLALLGSVSVDKRILGRTGRAVSVIGLGTWQLGRRLGRRRRERTRSPCCDAAVESGVTFLDTADVYGDGRSEQLIGRFLAGSAGRGVTVATKMGRRVAQDPENYTLDNFRAWTDRSRANLGVDTLDLVQLHCPPTPVYSSRRGLRRAGHAGRRGAHRRLRGQRGDLRRGADRDRAAGRGQRADHPQRVPAQAAGPGAARGARRPGSASSPGCRSPPGCCPAGTPRDTVFAADDHRTYNRHGEAFDVGRDVLRRGLRDRRATRPASSPALVAAPGATPGPGRAALGHPAARRHHRHPRRPQPGAGPAERGRGGPAAAAATPRWAQIEDLYDRRIRAQVAGRW